MKVEGLLFSFFAVFLGIAAIVYWVFSKDPTGTAALSISCGLGALIGGYLLFTGRRIGMRPQDLPDAEVADGAGELGSFSGGSYYPFFIAASSSVVMSGLVFGVWLSLLGGALLLYCVMGLVFEQFWHPGVPD
jgi:Cytochrome c oxidase subunit IV